MHAYIAGVFPQILSCAAELSRIAVISAGVKIGD